MFNPTLRSKLFAKVALSWLSAEQGGRKRAIGTTEYAATAYFAEREKQLFSVILHFPVKCEGNLKFPSRIDLATMSFLAPELVASHLQEGTDFYITEGARVVAKGKVLSVKLVSSITSKAVLSRLKLKDIRQNRDSHMKSKKIRTRTRTDHRNIIIVHRDITEHKNEQSNRGITVEYEEFTTRE